MILRRASYSRKSAINDTKNLYIFIDNCDRTSGKIEISDESNYSKRFNKKGLKRTAAYSASIRGLDNAFPITIQRRVGENWTEEEFEEFKKVIDDDIKVIKKACKKLKPVSIVFPCSGLLNVDVGRITFERTPRLYEYIIKKEIELRDFEV